MSASQTPNRKTLEQIADLRNSFKSKFFGNSVLLLYSVSCIVREAPDVDLWRSRRPQRPHCEFLHGKACRRYLSSRASRSSGAHACQSQAASRSVNLRLPEPLPPGRPSTAHAADRTMTCRCAASKRTCAPAQQPQHSFCRQRHPSARHKPGITQPYNHLNSDRFTGAVSRATCTTGKGICCSISLCTTIKRTASSSCHLRLQHLPAPAPAAGSPRGARRPPGRRQPAAPAAPPRARPALQR